MAHSNKTTRIDPEDFKYLRPQQPEFVREIFLILLKEFVISTKQSDIEIDGLHDIGYSLWKRATALRMGAKNAKDEFYEEKEK